MVVLSALITEGLVHMMGEGAVEAGVVRADQEYEKVLKAFEWAMELQKQKREDIRDLQELRTGRMDMYQLVNALLLGFCMVMFCENPLVYGAQRRKWILQPFLVSNISAMGCLFISLWLSINTSTGAHFTGVSKLLQKMRIQLPDPDELTQIRQRFALRRAIFRRGDQSSPFDGQAGTALRGGQVPAALQLQTAEQDPSSPTSPSVPHHTPAAWNAEDHVEDYLRSQEKEALFEVYTRAMLIVGVNQLLQALSYYLIGAIGKASPTGAFTCALGIQGLAILLLLLDVDLGDSDEASWPDVLRAFFYHMLPPLIAGFVLIMERVWSFHELIIIATLSFVLHMLWIYNILDEIALTTDSSGSGKACSRFTFVRHMVDANRSLVGRDGLSSKQLVSLPWLVTERFFSLILLMWVITIVMNVAEVLFSFEYNASADVLLDVQESHTITSLPRPLRAGGFMLAN